MHFDVLEHVPDHRRALRECYRVLREGGQLLFTLPFFYNLEKHMVRARLSEDGVEHVMPPAFHGNPVGGGALVFYHPGRELLTDLADAGFETKIGFAHNLGFGLTSSGCPWPNDHTWPFVFLATKPLRPLYPPTAVEVVAASPDGAAAPSETSPKPKRTRKRAPARPSTGKSTRKRAPARAAAGAPARKRAAARTRAGKPARSSKGRPPEAE